MLALHFVLLATVLFLELVHKLVLFGTLFLFQSAAFFISLSVHLDHCHQPGLIASSRGTCVVNFSIYLNLTLVAFYSSH